MGGALGRRGFLRRASGRHRPVTLSCGRLYVQYVDAAGSGRLHEFTRALEQEIGSASEIHLVEREWLAREDFRRMVEGVLPRRKPMQA